MNDRIKVDVRGLSCPEPVMLTMDAMDENPGRAFLVLANEAHTRTNIEKMLKHQGVAFSTVEKGSEYEITFSL
jgi:tRNA 2-thiouridine synthesizing protein A